MKIFISHSSKDKWAAKRISSELNNIGVKTFLDQKDIKTGESIDESIQSNIADCDDLLILISPASLNSHWVLIELGGAIALKKNIIPIFLYVGANEIPDPINKLLGRNINEIEKYYEELGIRIKGDFKTKSYSNKIKSSRYSVGDIIRLPNKPKMENVDPGWNDQMNNYLGEITKITKIIKTGENIEAALVEIDEGKWTWALSWIKSI